MFFAFCCFTCALIFCCIIASFGLFCLVFSKNNIAFCRNYSLDVTYLEEFDGLVSSVCVRYPDFSSFESFLTSDSDCGAVLSELSCNSLTLCEYYLLTIFGKSYCILSFFFAFFCFNRSCNVDLDLVSCSYALACSCNSVDSNCCYVLFVKESLDRFAFFNFTVSGSDGFSGVSNGYCERSLLSCFTACYCNLSLNYLSNISVAVLIERNCINYELAVVNFSCDVVRELAVDCYCIGRICCSLLILAESVDVVSTFFTYCENSSLDSLVFFFAVYFNSFGESDLACACLTVTST